MSSPFTELCQNHVYPLYSTLCRLKVSDSKDHVLNTMLYELNLYLEANRYQYTDLYLKEEINHFFRQWEAYKDKGGLPRKNIDAHLYKVLYKIAEMLVSHNSIFPHNAIYNENGRLRDHYTSNGKIPII